MAYKGIKYKNLIKQIDDALENEYYFEASWIAYAILEDRLISILKKSGGANNAKGNEIRMMGPKIEQINERISDCLNLRKALMPDMLEGLKNWKNNRDRLMHAMANEDLSISEIEELAKDLAITGRKWVSQLCSACYRLKKINAKDR